MRPDIHEIFRHSYRELRPRAPLPDLHIQFYPFANLNSNVRLREGKLRVRLSDILEGAPETVWRAIAHILLAKIYGCSIERGHSMRYRKYISSHSISEKARLLRQIMGRKRIDSARGQTYDLETIFDDLNSRFFHGLMARPQITWSRHISRRRLGHYDPAHNAIVISKVFDHPRVPRPAVEYIVYHEMLHLKHPVTQRGARRCIHSPDFHADERLFPEIERAKLFLKKL